MKTCPKCEFQQDEGVFCANCGAQIEATAQSSETAATLSGQTSSNVNVDKVKNGLENYWDYFWALIKNPSNALQKDENEFGNGLITLILFVVASSLSLYFLITKTVGSLPIIGSPVAQSVPFLGTNIRFVIIAALLIAISFFSAVMMLKAGKNQTSVKSLLSQYGGLSVPFTALNIIAILFALMGSGMLTMTILGISTTLFLYFIPVLFVYDKVSATNPDGQKIYLSLASLIIISIATTIVFTIFIVALLGSIANNIPTSPL